jgi:vitamin B12 transporter
MRKKTHFNIKRVGLPLLLAWLTLLSAKAIAQTTPAAKPGPSDKTHPSDNPRPSDTARSLRPLIITARPISERDTSASPAQILKSSDLEKLNSFSVADAVRYFSGVQLKDYGGIGGLKTINVRSLGSTHTGVFYDGVQLGNAQNGQTDLGKFSLDNIDEIALYEGQKNTIFQPAAAFASGNSLYLTTRQPDTTSIRASFHTGSFGLVDPSVLWQQKLNGNLYSTLSAETINAAGRYKFRYTNGFYDTTAIRQNGDIAAQRLEAGLNGKGRDSSDWSVKGYIYHSDRGLPGAIVANNFNSDQRLWDRDVFLQTKYHKDWRKYSLLAIAKYSNDYIRYLDPSFVTTTGPLDNRYHEQEAYASLAQRYRINNWWSAALATDYRWNTLDANLYQFAYPTRQTLLAALATELHFSRLDLQGNLLNTIVHDKVRAGATSGNTTRWTPAILASWQPLKTRAVHVRAFYKDIFRMPTFNDLYYTFVGNTFLKPESAKQTDLGATYTGNYNGRLLKAISAQVDAYYNLVTDKIVAVPGANLFRWTMMNIGKVTIKGITANLQTDWQPAAATHLTVGLTYTHEEAPGVPYDPLNSGSALIAAAWQDWNLHYSVVYTGYRYDEAAEIPANYLQPWYTHDIGLTYTTAVKQEKLKFAFEVNNLFNQYYDVIANFPMPGRNYRLTLQITRG